MKKMIVFLMAAVLSFGVYALIWYDASMNSGSFNQTVYNSSGGYVYLNYSDSGNTTFVSVGYFTSEVMDMSGYAQFFNITWEGKNESCPYGNMSYIDKLGGFCIDQYEASMPNATAINMSSNETEIAQRNAPGTMQAHSAGGVIPWVRINRDNARIACTNAGKYLCTSEQWLAAANLKGQVYDLPAIVTDCNVVSGSPAECTDLSYEAGDACTTGYMSNCVSSENVYDMIGNVYEWVNETVTTIAPGASQGWYYPSDTGWQTSPGVLTDKYGDDGTYFLSGTNANRAVLRGGYWADGADAGVFTAFLYYGASYTVDSVGFRCCSS